MIILYIILIVYILAVNFYAFLLVKTLRDTEKEDEKSHIEFTSNVSATKSPTLPEKPTRRLYLTGLLGGAVTVYVCMFLFKYKRNDLLLMVLMPVLGVLNIYLFALLFKSGFGFLVMR